ncbi:MAG: hypothetical protein DRG83_16490, partial [Deltaproteobacteria bacterium]
MELTRHLWKQKLFAILVPLYLFLFFPFNLLAYETPGTGITWTMSDLVSMSGGAVDGSEGTYTINEDIIISAGDTIIVSGGDTLKFASGTGLSVNGTLLLNGSSSNLITVTSVSATPSPGDWKGISFYHHSSGNITYSIIEYAQKGIYAENYTSPQITYCIIRHNLRGVEVDRTSGNYQPNLIVNYSDFLDNTEYNYVAIRTWNWSFHTLDARWNYWGSEDPKVISSTI